MIIVVRHDANAEEVAVALASQCEMTAFRAISGEYIDRGQRPPESAVTRERDRGFELVRTATKTDCRQATGQMLARYGYMTDNWPNVEENDLIDAARERVIALWGEEGP